MKKTAYVINTSRGPIIDEGALVTALRNKSIAGAGQFRIVLNRQWPAIR